MRKVQSGARGWLLLAGLLGLLGAFGSNPARAERREPFTMPGGGDVRTLWSDGEDLLFVATNRELRALRRGGDTRYIKLPDWPFGRIRLAGAGTGDAAVVVAWTGEGHAARIRDQRVVATTRLTVGDCLGVVDPAGAFFCVRPSGEVLLWPAGQDEAPRLVPAPAAELDVRVATLGPGGRLLLLPHPATDPATGARLAYQLQDGVLRPLLLDEKKALPHAAREALWLGAHYSAATDTLWVSAAPDRLLALSLQRGVARELPIPETDEASLYLQSLGGAHVADAGGGRDVLWLQAGGRLVVYDGEHFYALAPDRPVNPHDVRVVHFDVGAGIGYLVTDARVEALPLGRPPWGRSGAEPLRRPRSSVRWTSLPLLNLGLGPMWRLGTSPVPQPASLPPADPVPPTAGSGTELALDLRLGLVLGARRRGTSDKSSLFCLLPELGYSYGKTDPSGTHLFLAGLGVGYGNVMALLRYSPHFVVGRALGETALGVRHGLGLTAVYSLLSVEVVHQYLHYTGTDAGGAPLGGQHDVRLMFSVNLVPVVAFVALATVFSRTFR